MIAVEGCSSVSDADGNLLFYTSGGTVWNRNHQIMPNGAGLSGNGPLGPGGLNVGSSAHGVAIVQSPSNADQYYVITTDAIEDVVYDAYYTLVDLSLDGGLGDVVTDRMNILFATDIAEGAFAVRGANCLGYWIILHKRYGPEFLAFKIDMNGFESTPVVSTGINGSDDLTQLQNGQCAFNPEGSLLLHNSSGGVEIANFDNISGSLYDFVSISNNIMAYPTFSPDGSKVYFFQSGWFRQMNLSLLPDLPAVENSIISLDSGYYMGSRVGPDGKLYAVDILNGDALSVVNAPNNAGLACNFSAAAVSLLSASGPGGIGTYVELGADAMVNPVSDTIINTIMDTVICFDSTFALSANPAFQWVKWNTGTVGTDLTVNQSGTYWCYGWKDCIVYIDSFRLQFVNFTSPLGADTAICPDDEIMLDATLEGGTYLWNDGSGMSVLTVNTPGSYWVKITKEGCILSDTVLVENIQPSLHILEPDTLICEGVSLNLHVAASLPADFAWSTGDTGPNTIVNQAGIYMVAATNICGILYDSISVETENCDCNVLMPNAFSPNADGRNDEIKALLFCSRLTQFALTIFNRYGQVVFETSDPAQGWNGNFNGGRADVGTYFYYLTYKTDGEIMKKKGEFTLLR